MYFLSLWDNFLDKNRTSAVWQFLVGFWLKLIAKIGDCVQTT